MWELTIRNDFSAAHQLRNYDGKCEQIHGHNWDVELVFRCGELDARGIAMDFKDLQTIAHQVLEQLDHTLLNETPPFTVENPSAENVARHIYREIACRLLNRPCAIWKVVVHENPRSAAAYMEDAHGTGPA